eukprot:SAG22_NODE_180_length_16069_cov_5.323231_14_plen_360_part_00
MWKATEAGDAPALGRLIAAGGADVDEEGEWPGVGVVSALVVAAGGGHTDCVEALLSAGADANEACRTAGSFEGMTPLYIAAERGHGAIVRLLLDHGPAVDAAKSGGYTPLFVAAEKGHEVVVKILLDHQANVDAANNDGATPLYMAAQKGHAASAELLVRAGAAVDAAMNDGTTLLVMAARGNHEAVVKILLAGGADPAKQTPFGTAAEVASANGHHAVAAAMVASRHMHLASVPPGTNRSRKKQGRRTPKLCKYGLFCTDSHCRYGHPQWVPPAAALHVLPTYYTQHVWAGPPQTEHAHAHGGGEAAGAGHAQWQHWQPHWQPQPGYGGVAPLACWAPVDGDNYMYQSAAGASLLSGD